jgi:hypothetical protein
MQDEVNLQYSDEMAFFSLIQFINGYQLYFANIAWRSSQVAAPVASGLQHPGPSPMLLPTRVS